MTTLVQSIMLQASAKDVIMTYTNPLVSIPIVISATGIEDMISIENSEGAKMEAGTDGVLSAHVVPSSAAIKGKIMLQPLSPALAAIIQVVQNQFLSSYVTPGTLNITNPSGQWNVTFPNFIWRFNFAGFSMGEKVKDVDCHFAAGLPNTSIFGSLISIGTAVLGGLL